MFKGPFKLSLSSQGGCIILGYKRSMGAHLAHMRSLRFILVEIPSLPTSKLRKATTQERERERQRETFTERGLKFG